MNCPVSFWFVSRRHSSRPAPVGGGKKPIMTASVITTKKWRGVNPLGLNDRKDDRQDNDRCGQAFHDQPEEQNDQGGHEKKGYGRQVLQEDQEEPGHAQTGHDVLGKGRASPQE